MFSLIKKVFLRIRRIPRYLLVKRYKLGSFHVSNEEDKKYVSAIKNHLNQRINRNSVIEIGVGLGDILLGLNFKKLVGADHKQEVLDAIKFRYSFQRNSKKNIIFKKLKFETETINGTYDVVILVNWIHTIDSKTLKKKLEFIYKNNLSCGGEIIFDVVTDQTNPSIYKHRHSPQFLNKNIGSVIKSLGNFVISSKISGQNREIFSLIKK
jgi:SAM-dependent methyltransferase